MFTFLLSTSLFGLTLADLSCYVGVSTTTSTQGQVAGIDIDFDLDLGITFTQTCPDVEFFNVSSPARCFQTETEYSFDSNGVTSVTAYGAAACSLEGLCELFGVEGDQCYTYSTPRLTFTDCGGNEFAIPVSTATYGCCDSANCNDFEFENCQKNGAANIFNEFAECVINSDAFQELYCNITDAVSEFANGNLCFEEIREAAAVYYACACDAQSKLNTETLEDILSYADYFLGVSTFELDLISAISGLCSVEAECADGEATLSFTLYVANIEFTVGASVSDNEIKAAVSAVSDVATADITIVANSGTSVSIKVYGKNEASAQTIAEEADSAAWATQMNGELGTSVTVTSSSESEETEVQSAKTSGATHITVILAFAISFISLLL